MRNSLVLLLVVVLASESSAQSKISLGPNAGFGASWISGFDNSRYQPAGNVGVSLIYSAVEHFGVGADLKYTFEGGKREYTAGQLVITDDLRADYIRIPLKAIYFFNDFGDRVRPKISLGPSFGFLVGGNMERETMTSNGSTSVSKTDITNVYKSFDVGIDAAAGLNYRLVKNTWLTLDLSYLHGLTNNAENTSVTTAGMKNRNLQLNVGVNFGLK